MPIAGLGTRFLPATKVVPKEMLPICGKPIVHILVEEAYKSGIKEIIFVINKEKEQIIRDYFSHETPTSRKIAQKGKEKSLSDLNHLLNHMKFRYVVQRNQKGDGHAILQAKKYIKKDEAFAVMFGDDIVATNSNPTALSQLIKAYNKLKSPIIALEQIPRSKTSSYGIIKPLENTQSSRNMRKPDNKLTPNTSSSLAIGIADLVEKPSPSSAPSTLGVIGKYVLTSDIFKYLKKAKGSFDNEIRLIDGLKKSLESSKLYGLKVKGIRYDTGTLDGFKKAICEIKTI